MKTNKNKQLLIDQLKKTPVIQVACEKVGVGRATFYRWKNDDEKFAQDTSQAINDGNGLVNDMAESQLMSAIRDKNLTAIIFWLKNHHPTYGNKLELTGKILTQSELLTPEQEELVKQALQNAGLIKTEVEK